jgi:hypothetical protein
MTPRLQDLPEGALREAALGAWVPVVGVSMQPLLPHGSRVRAGPAAETPAPGDLVLFVLDEMITVHRVVGQTAGRLWTKGDGALRAERDPLDPARILGVVVEAERGGRRTEMHGRAWRRVGRWIARWSRGWERAAALLPPAFLNHPSRPASRAARKLLLLGNRLLPALADLLLRHRWR